MNDKLQEHLKKLEYTKTPPSPLDVVYLQEEIVYLREKIRIMQEKIVYLREKIRIMQEENVYLREKIRIMQEKHKMEMENLSNEEAVPGMKRAVYHVILEPFGDEVFIKIQKGAKPLTVEIKDGHPRLWYVCDPDAPLEELTVHVLPTGFPTSLELDKLPYLGTIFDLPYVWHLFLERNEG